MRRAARRDGNHTLIAQAFERLGCTVLDTPAIGIAGFPDLVVGLFGVWHVVEVKNPETRYGRAGLNSNQSAFDRDSNGERMWTVSSEDEVLAVVRNWRAIK